MNTFFADFKIGRRLFVAFGVLAFILLGANGLALWSNNAINAGLDTTVLYANKLERGYILSAALDKVFIDIGTLALSPDTADLSVLKADIESQRASFKEQLTYFKEAATNETDKGLLKNIEDANSAAKAANDEILALAAEGPEAWLAGNREKAQKIFHEQSAPANEVIDQAQTEYTAYRQTRIKDKDDAAQALVDSLRLWTIVLALVSLTIAIFLSVFITRSIAIPLADAKRFTEQLAGGNFSQDPPEAFRKRGDEIGDLGRAFQIMVANVRTLLGSLTSGVQTTASSSTELTAIAEETSAGASESLQRANGVAAAAEEMNANTLSVAAGMEQAYTSLHAIATAVEEMTATIGEIARNSEQAHVTTAQAAQQVDQFSVVMKGLGQSAQEIGKVTETITRISSQTNLLALVAIVCGSFTGWPMTMWADPAAWNPSILGDFFERPHLLYSL